MKARKVVPEPYAVVDHNYQEFHVYKDGRVFVETPDGEYDWYPTYEDDYDEIKQAGLEVLR